MIKITLLSGTYAGETREIPRHISPATLFSDLLRYEWEWEVDYSMATQMEVLEWFKFDLGFRVLRTIAGGRPVIFLGKTYVAANPTDEREVQRVAEKIEDDIVRSGRLITLDYDDDRGLSIGVGGHEH